MLGGGGLAEQVFDQQADAERAGKGAQVFERGDGVLDGARRPAVVAFAEMHDEIAKGMCSAASRARLISSMASMRRDFSGCSTLTRGRAGAAHFAIGKERGVHGKRLKRVGAEPLGQLGDVLAAGVVKVLARGKDLDCLRAGTVGKLQQARDEGAGSGTGASRGHATWSRGPPRRAA